MNFLKNLFGKKDSNNKGQRESKPTIEKELTEEQSNFEKEFESTIIRYLGHPALTHTLVAIDPFTHEVIPWSIGLNGVFEDCSKIRSLPDRRSLIYRNLDSSIGHQLKLWQTIQRYVDDRYSEQAIKIALDRASSIDLKDSNYWASLSNAYFVFGAHNKAGEAASKSLAIEPGTIRGRIALANVQHVTGRHDEAHQIFNEILTNTIPKDKTGTMGLPELVGYEKGVLHSSIYCLGILKSSKDVNEESWNWASDEFYHCPYFRSEHAYWLNDQNKNMEAMAKLITLSKEMPFFKEAAVNAKSMIDQMKVSDKMPEEYKYLTELVAQHEELTNKKNDNNVS